jgi:hypothetical protein
LYVFARTPNEVNHFDSTVASTFVELELLEPDVEDEDDADEVELSSEDTEADELSSREEGMVQPNRTQTKSEPRSIFFI